MPTLISRSGNSLAEADEVAGADGVVADGDDALVLARPARSAPRRTPCGSRRSAPRRSVARHRASSSSAAVDLLGVGHLVVPLDAVLHERDALALDGVGDHARPAGRWSTARARRAGRRGRGRRPRGPPSRSCAHLSRQRLEPLGVLGPRALLQPVAVDDRGEVGRGRSGRRSSPPPSCCPPAARRRRARRTCAGRAPRSLAASAQPTATGKPWPERAGVGLDAGDLGPVGVAVQRRQRAPEGLQLAAGKKPQRASVEYSAPAQWPLLRMKRSRSGRPGARVDVQHGAEQGDQDVGDGEIAADVAQAGRVDHRDDTAADERRHVGEDARALVRRRVVHAAPEVRVVLGRTGSGSVSRHPRRLWDARVLASHAGSGVPPRARRAGEVVGSCALRRARRRPAARDRAPGAGRAARAPQRQVFFSKTPNSSALSLVTSSQSIDCFSG